MSDYVDIIVPTFREAGNLPTLIERVGQVRNDSGLDLRLWLIDDMSNDGSKEAVEAAGQDWVKFHERQEEPRSLSLAVMTGFELTDGPYVLVMDGDLSHPPEMVPAMIERLKDGAEFVIGSRFVPGGTTDAEWSMSRRLNSWLATMMARPLTRLKDPMAGFFALPRMVLEREEKLDPVGYKIGLEILVKCDPKRVDEVPIHFSERQQGNSKLSIKVQLQYIGHVLKLMAWKIRNRGK